MRALIYCRVSTKEQTQNLSLPTQRRDCERYCAVRELDVAVEGGEVIGFLRALYRWDGERLHFDAGRRGGSPT